MRDLLRRLLCHEVVDAGWGSQIRSYGLDPYQMVKDHRTSVEIGNTAAVLDDRLNAFIEAYLRQESADRIERSAIFRRRHRRQSQQNMLRYA